MTIWLATLLSLALSPTCAQRAESGLPAATAGPQDLVFDQQHRRWSEVLGRHVQGSLFDYRTLLESRGDLDQYLLDLRGVQRADFDSWTREQRYAFWINAYNAFTVHLVLMHYPVKSIRDIGSTLSPVWKREFIPLGHLFGEGSSDQISLDTIEHQILRPQFKDARVHAAVNCASESCPPLAAQAYRAEVLDQQLDERTRAWLADASLNRFERERRRAEVSEIFDWFAADFERDAGSVRAWLARYAPPQEAEWLGDDGKFELRTLPYSWKLNDVPAQER